MDKTIRDIIGKDRTIYSVSIDVSIRHAIQYLRDHNTGAVAVCIGAEVVGVFSESDVLRRVALEDLDLDGVSVREAMSSPIHWISMDERCDVAKAIMVDKGLAQLAVMDPPPDFCGFVSSRELLEADLADSRDLVGKLNDEYFEHPARD